MIKPFKQTKQISTIGPATETVETLQEMIVAGMNVARFNTKHSDPVWHKERIARVHQAAKQAGTTVAVLLDLQGPEIRALTPGERTFSIEAGDEIIVTATELPGDMPQLIVPAEVVNGLQVGSLFSLADGACEFKIVRVENGTAIGQADYSCEVKHRKTMNTPGLVLDMPSLTERDIQYLDGVDLSQVDFVGLSFVRSVADIEHFRAALQERGSNAAIVAKIENQVALDNLDSIIGASDAVMIGRGDLGVEVPYEELTYWQIVIIEKCRFASKPVITATEMVKSMLTNPRPTRAEISDVGHSVFDGTDAVMLSDETTIGKYPVKTVAVQSKIAAYTEKKVTSTKFKDQLLAGNTSLQKIVSEVADASQIVIVSDDLELTTQLAALHLPTPIHQLSTSDVIIRRTQLLFGVTADVYTGDMNDEAAIIEHYKTTGFSNAGDKVAIITMQLSTKSATTNVVVI
ncbi:MAG: pyruvate kinase [bacterium]|nr:pyruvate kinase [bacterium]